MRFLILIIAASFLFVYLYLGLQPSPFYDYPKMSVKIGNSYYTLYVADTVKRREQGLSGSTVLKKNEGMLFSFYEPNFYGFWMKDMKFPVDIIYISGAVVVDIKENVLPDSYPETFFGKLPYDKVVELNAGESKKNGIAAGQIVNWRVREDSNPQPIP